MSVASAMRRWRESTSMRLRVWCQRATGRALSLDVREGTRFDDIRVQVAPSSISIQASSAESVGEPARTTLAQSLGIDRCRCRRRSGPLADRIPPARSAVDILRKARRRRSRSLPPRGIASPQRQARHSARHCLLSTVIGRLPAADTPATGISVPVHSTTHGSKSGPIHKSERGHVFERGEA